MAVNRLVALAAILDTRTRRNIRNLLAKERMESFNGRQLAMSVKSIEVEGGALRGQGLLGGLSG